MRGKQVSLALRAALEPLKGTDKALAVSSLAANLAARFWRDLEDAERTDRAYQAIGERFLGLLPKTTEYPWLADRTWICVKCQDATGYVWLSWIPRVQVAETLASS